MTVEGRDWAYAPNAAQVAQFKAAGVRVGGGYLASSPNMGLLNPWSRDEFDRIRPLGGTPIAFCSGWDDPAWVKVTAAAWGLLPCLDDEAGVRGDGSWVQPWLDTSAAGLYGSYGVHPGRNAAFHVLAAYPTSGDPAGVSWWSYTVRPPGPLIWQWAGTHDEYGTSCDSWWADDSFGGTEMATIDDVWNDTQYLRGMNDENAMPRLASIMSTLAAIGQRLGIEEQELQQLVARPGLDVAGLAAALAPQIEQLDLVKLEADLVQQLPTPLAGQLLAALKAALP